MVCLALRLVDIICQEGKVIVALVKLFRGCKSSFCECPLRAAFVCVENGVCVCSAGVLYPLRRRFVPIALEVACREGFRGDLEWDEGENLENRESPIVKIFHNRAFFIMFVISPLMRRA